MVACAVPFFYLDLDNVPLILGAIVVGTVGGVVGAQRVQMTQMPQMVALFNGVGGGAAALVALLELHEIVEVAHDASWFVLAATAFTIFVGSVSFAGSVVTFAKLQELMTSAPVVFPGLAIAFAAALLAGVGLSTQLVLDPRRLGRHRAGPGRPGLRRAAGAAGRRRRRTDRDLAAQRVHRPDRGRRRLRARQRRAPGRRARSSVPPERS